MSRLVNRLARLFNGERASGRGEAPVILVAEDSPVDQVAAAGMLKNLGYAGELGAAATAPESVSANGASTHTTTPMTTHAAQPVVLDADIIADLRQLSIDVGRNVLGELAAMFIRSGTAQIDQLHAAVTEGKWEAADKIVHALKGSGGNVGARGLVHGCTQLQLVLDNGDSPAVRTAIAVVESEFAAARAALEKELSAAIGL